MGHLHFARGVGHGAVFFVVEAAGNTTSARSAVSVRNMSWTTSNSRPARRSGCDTAKVFTGFAPTTYSAFNFPAAAASIIARAVSPGVAEISAPQILP